MDTAGIIQSLDREVSNLQKARNILAGERKPPQRETKLRRRMSAEGRKAIAQGQKRRWAKQKAA